MQQQGYKGADKIVPVSAGGDTVLVDALPKFEDDPDAGIKQLLAQGWKPGDGVIGWSASGSATFVLKTVEKAALESEGRAMLVACNKAATVKQRAIDLKRTHLFDDDFPGKFTLVDVDTPPPALAGSSHMSPTSVQFAMALGIAAYFDPEYLDYAKHIRQLIEALSDPTIAAKLAQLAIFESGVYKRDGKILFKVESPTSMKSWVCFLMNVFQDVTERSPTFNLTRQGAPDKEPSPLARVLLDFEDTTAAWSAIIMFTPLWPWPAWTTAMVTG